MTNFCVMDVLKVVFCLCSVILKNTKNTYTYIHVEPSGPSHAAQQTDTKNQGRNDKRNDGR